MSTTQVPNSWSVGELAKAARVTTRTLRHYDALGLLSPQGRTSGGHRRYDGEDLKLLFQILALRGLGFALDDIPQLLNSDEAAMLETVQAQQSLVRSEQERNTRLLARLEGLAEALENDTASLTTAIVRTMEDMTMPITLTRIYTKAGDSGETDLADRTRVPKTDARVEAGGAVDELNTVVGICLTVSGDAGAQELQPWLQQIQNDLFDLGADLSRDQTEVSPRSVTTEYVAWLEHLCDKLNHDLPTLKSFVLPGGSVLSAHLHAARAVCRRAERRALAIPSIDQVPIAYLNRLSDAFFIMSRVASTTGEALWEPRRERTVIS